MTFEQFIQSLRSALQDELPGKDIQYKMASAYRFFHEETNTETKASSVLILLYYKKNQVFTVLIKRTEKGDPHSGQISLPGGRFETGDKSLIATALRETREEIGIAKEDVKVIGTLSRLFIPVSNYEVLPVVGFVGKLPEFTISKEEVEFLIEFEINRLLQKNVIKIHETKLKNKPICIPYFDIHGNMVWGATAMILNELVEVFRNNKCLKDFLETK